MTWREVWRMDDETVIAEVEDTTGIIRVRDPRDEVEDGYLEGTVLFFSTADLDELTAAAWAAQPRPRLEPL